MSEGQLVAIYITNRKGSALQSVEQIEAVVGRGLQGDRYFGKEGADQPDKEVTLIEIESLEALKQELGIALAPSQSRRNLVTRGVALNDLVDREFTVGPVLLRGLRLCEPCDHLEKLTVSGVKKGLCHRGGLRAQVLRGGTIRTGDRIQPVESEIVSS